MIAETGLAAGSDVSIDSEGGEKRRRSHPQVSGLRKCVRGDVIYEDGKPQGKTGFKIKSRILLWTCQRGSWTYECEAQRS